MKFPVEMIRKNQHLNNTYKPELFDLSEKSGAARLAEIIRDHPGLTVFDEIESQLRDLIKLKNPTRKLTDAEYNRLISEHIGTTPMDEYGLWAYYPWSNRLVHLLGEKEFVLLRTSRNIYKITPEERDILATKKIGVIGLSVGQSVALTSAMERICGEIRLADFDVLELTNLNRIRTGIHNLNLPKVYAVAREISEIDPYIKVVCYEKGLTEENMDAFFLEGGKLDLLIEESDGFDIKIISRHKARSLQVPVIMEASDRCMVDVERFDLEPDRPILHGLVDHLDIAKLKSLTTNEEKIPYMLDVLGIDTCSTRLKASMLEIEQTINTWPQLASAVAMGGGITTDVSRRIMLNQYKGSGRFHVDVEELIGDKKTIVPAIERPAEADIKLDKLEKIIPATEASADDIALSLKDAEAIVNAACLAPSGGNTQPWRWFYQNKQLHLVNPYDGNHNFLGYDNLSLYVAHGAATENIIRRSQQMGMDVTYELFPQAQAKDLVATFHFHTKGSKSSSEASYDLSLAEAIGTRHTNRILGKREPLEQTALDKLSGLVPSGAVKFFTSDEELALIADVLGETDRIRLLEKDGHRDFVNEIRWTGKDAVESRDGIDIHTLDITPTELAGLNVARSPEIIERIKAWGGGGAFKKLTVKSIDAASAFGVVYMPDSSHKSFFEGGRLVERLWLGATSAGIAFQPVSASVFIYENLLRGHAKGISTDGQKQLHDLRPRYEKALQVREGFTPVFLFRLSKAGEPDVKSLRKPLSEMFKFAG